jgi:two-component system, cell cycle response regulator
MADPPKLPPRPPPRRDARQDDEHTPLVEVPVRHGKATVQNPPQFGNVPVPPGAFQHQQRQPPPPPPQPPTQPLAPPAAPPPQDFILSSMLPPKLDALGDDDVEQTRVGATIVGAPAYRPSANSAPKRAYVTVLQGARAGEMFKITTDETILGRGPQSGIHLDSDGVSRKHARIVKQGEGQFVLEDLGSTNGTWVDEQRITFRMLKDGDRVQVGTEVIVRFTFMDEMEAQLQQQLYESAVRDPLTRAYNRKHFSERLKAEVAHALRHRGQLSLILLDIDHFKRVNDTYGHPAGDAVLRGVASAIAKAIRTEDVFARIGGEEFALLARGIDVQNAVLFAERLRRGIERLAIPWQGSAIPVTSSFGVSTLIELYNPHGEPPRSLDGDVLVARADQRLYMAKGGGRNRVVGP